MWRWTFHLQICEDEVSSSDMWRWAAMSMHVASKCSVFSEWTVCTIGGRHITCFFSLRNLIPCCYLIFASIMFPERHWRWIWLPEHLPGQNTPSKHCSSWALELKSSRVNKIGVLWICSSSKERLGGRGELSELEGALSLKSQQLSCMALNQWHCLSSWSSHGVTLIQNCWK